MDRTALLHRAAEVRRRIFASLPWEVRLATVFARLALDTGYLNDLGRQIGAEMLQAGVTDMPPAPKWKPGGPHAALSLPRDYMGKFTHDVYGLLISKFRNPKLAEEAIIAYVGKLSTGEIKLQAVSRTTAESFIRHGALLEAMSLARKALREQARQESLEDVDEDSKSVSRELADPNAFAKFRKALSDKMWKEWMEYLAKHVHPDIPMYLELKMEGYDDVEIIGSPKKGIPSKLPHWNASPQAWAKPSGPGAKIIPKSNEFLESKGTTVQELLSGDV
jgi:hypothetical protein